MQQPTTPSRDLAARTELTALLAHIDDDKPPCAICNGTGRVRSSVWACYAPEHCTDLCEACNGEGAFS